MRHWNLKQENIFQAYVQLGKKILHQVEMQHENTISQNRNWELITSEGIWKLPITKQYGGAGFSWDECVIAVEGLIKTYQDQEFFSSIISHLALLYILLQYGTETQKNMYLPLLMQGAIGIVCVEDEWTSSLNNLNITVLKDITISFSIKKNTYILNDFKNFKRLFYGMLAAESAYYIVDDCKNILRKSQSQILDISIRSKCKDAERNIHKSMHKFNLLLTNLVDKMNYKQAIYHIKK